MRTTLSTYLELARSHINMASALRRAQPVGSGSTYRHHIASARYWLLQYWLAKPRS